MVKSEVEGELTVVAGVVEDEVDMAWVKIAANLKQLEKPSCQRLDKNVLPETYLSVLRPLVDVFVGSLCAPLCREGDELMCPTHAHIRAVMSTTCASSPMWTRHMKCASSSCLRGT